ncbi:MAG TPA: zf-HC2 domain-containing protein [Streptosporangiaceae bacterium]|nr:zf-HC2 domain-containing protein [Streptosporangiaceae bacterium]
MKDRDHQAELGRLAGGHRSVRSSSSRHPAAAQVSLCRDGQLGPRDAAAIRAHLQSCPRCRRVQTRLAEVRRILAHQTERSIPDAIALRIDQALIAEAAQVKGQWPPAPRKPLPSS